MTYDSNSMDFSNNPNAAYELAEKISTSNDLNITYIEIHKRKSDTPYPLNITEGSFRDKVQIYDFGFSEPQKVDAFPAKIDIVLKLEGIKYEIKDCGHNDYLGWGPNGIIELRKACFLKDIKMKIITVD